MARLIGNLTLIESNEKCLNENASSEFAFKSKILSQESRLSSGKQSGAAIWKYWGRSSEASTRNSSNDELPLLVSHSGVLESHIKPSPSRESMYIGEKTESCDTSKNGDKLNKSSFIKDKNTSVLRRPEHDGKYRSRFHENESPFSYKCYPLTNSEIFNWMNESWSEYEVVEKDINKCIIMDVNKMDSYKKNKKIITPFHSLAAPKISIGDYYISRIVKFVSLTPVDFCVMVILIRRVVQKSNGTLKVTSLTAHRLVLAATLLTYKLMYDVQYGIKFWAHIGGVPQWEMLMLEYHILKILNWDLSINYHEFKKTYLEILLGRDSVERILSKKTDISNIERVESQNEFDYSKINSDTSKRAKLQLNVSRNNSNRKK
ncbi:cyclin'cyclin' [Cryptosporidium canis]|uniref:Cyclin'cyclin n=1 Tax=Cryptosporidium canis TaxID=195482 RepID=A0ABQ8PE46_9CRYT|nr:cyclin'cyclin' [Cryptosporidium canis]KAJ1615492.1 cyclin'cyclin' [Cryptosporidium canis]